MTTKIKFWQWPNVLAIDACAIALAWLWVFADEQSAQLSTTAYVVLAVSVWLTYLSDRLFDATRQEEAQLLSTRHRFAKRNMRTLWQGWALVLLVNILIATTGLSPSQLGKGLALLLVCLAYSGFNYFLSRRFFPKELLVALIFAGGAQVFLPEPTEWPSVISYILLCLINCLMIAWKEKSVDALLQVRSLSSVLDSRWIYPLLASCIGLSLLSSCTLPLVSSMLILGGIHLIRERLGQELFRVLCDAALLTGPLFYFALHNL